MTREEAKAIVAGERTLMALLSNPYGLPFHWTDDNLVHWRFNPDYVRDILSGKWGASSGKWVAAGVTVTLGDAFHWSTTIEGHNYWSHIAHTRTLTPEARARLEEMLAVHEALTQPEGA